MAGKETPNQEPQKLFGPADRYECNKVPALFRPLALQFLDHVPLREDERVLDLACGTGIVARIVAPRVESDGQVVGVDINPEMLGVARENTPSGAAITWRVADAGDLPFEEESFSLVLCQQGFQFFADKSRALAEMRRVLAPGGRIALVVWQAVSARTQPYQWAVVEAFTRHVSAEAGEERRRLVHFFDGGGDLLRKLLIGAGFRQVEVRDLVYIRRRGQPEEFIREEKYEGLAPDVRAALVRDIRRAMEPFRNEEGTAVPYGLHLALAVK